MSDGATGAMGAMGRIGVDTGGTFTDVVAADGRSLKVLSTPADPASAIADGLTRILGGGHGRSVVLAHGTTVATNALLERAGGRVGLFTTEGHADVIEIARQVRPSLYDQWADRPEPLVPRDRRWEVSERLDPAGEELRAPGRLDPAVVDAARGCDSVAVCLLHADRSPDHERLVAAHLRAAGVDVVCSTAISPEFRDYERTVTSVVNAYLRRPCRAYLLRLPELADEVLVMTSAGGLIPVGDAADGPVALLLSGPAGGVLAAAAAASAAGYADGVTIDMGGTSTDVCLIRGGRPEPSAERVVAGLPIRMPALDVHTIGAGGGSIARVDAGGALVVGPESAGADPGPACYGRGGQRPTVTDADLIAGRIPVGPGLGGIGRLDPGAARAALERAGVTAAGVIAVVDAAMVQAVRRVSVERGVEPWRLALVAFGGAGPLHACALAEALGMPAVVVPPRAGVLSAVGMLLAPKQAEVVHSWPRPRDHDLRRAIAEMAAEARRRLGVNATSGPVEVVSLVDCRYAGQSHELSVPSVAEFPAEHLRRNGFARRGWPIEVVALRVSARSLSPVDAGAFPPVDRAGGHRGPTVISEPDCTVWVPEGWRADLHPAGSWILTRG